MSTPLSVLLAGGGTAGHVSPLLATAEALAASGARVAALGTAEGLEARLVPARGIALHTVPRVPLPRRPSADLLRLPVGLRAAVRATRRAMDEVAADVVVGFGGYVATPAYLAARRAGVPVVVHEQNSRPGLANRLGACLTGHVAVTFPGTPLRGAQVLGLPLRAEIAHLDRTAQRPGARARLGLDVDRPTLLVTGGSLGALHLNAAVLAVVGDLLDAGVQVLHLTGRGKAVEPVAGRGGARHVVLEYLDAMADGLAAADLVLCRAGAGTVCELAAVGLPAVFVPLAVGNGEQRLNARGAVRAGAALLVEDAALDPAWLRAHLLPLVTDGPRLDAMATASAALGVRDAAERLAAMVRVAGGRR